MTETVGELRKRLSAMGEPWQVDARLTDDEGLPDPPRGGQLGRDIPKESRLKPVDPDANIRELLSADPPSNPYLVLRWVEAGLLGPEAAVGLNPAKPDGEDPA